MKARENPFRSDRIESLAYRYGETTREQVMARLDALARRCAIVGPHGSGKTTLLEDIGAVLSSSGSGVKRVALTLERPAFPAGFLQYFFEGLIASDVILFDGADLMAPRDWMRFRRSTAKAGGLVVTSHRPGLLPTLVVCSTSLDLLQEIASELVGHEATGLPLKQLYEKHHGNLRDVFRELYEQFATR